MYKTRSECRREGERAFERDRYGDHRNPYSRYGSYDEASHHRDWDDGFRDADRRDQERREEEECRERREAQRRHEREMERQREEEEYYRDMQEREQQEEETFEDLTK
jgi:hypothetical protein